MTLPIGTITFLRSDIEGSMEHARALGARYDELNAEHAALVRAAITEHGGEVVRTEGDAFFAVFTEAGAAARAAVDIQRAMGEHEWPDGYALRVRIGLHTGSALRAGDDYGGFEVSRAARIADAGHGGQIVLSEAARALILADPPEGGEVLDLGRHRLKGVPRPERLFQLVAPGLEHEFEGLRTGHGPSEHLPQRTTMLIGRDDELRELSALLKDTRLLTLTGPGGTGKTTLAIELARRQAAEYRDGARFVDLQGIPDGSEVRPAMAQALGLLDGVSGAAADRLLSFVADHEFLLVVDNFEHVVDAAKVVRDVLDSSASTDCIVTSRIPLRIAAEQEYPVRPLDVGGDLDGTSDAVRLFVDRARRVEPSFTVDGPDSERVSRVCRLLDGLPLAIELAASQVGALPVAAIEDRLEQQRPLPGPGRRDAPERHRTVQAVTAWSYGMVDEPLRRLFRRLSVFRDSFAYEQAEEVCDAGHDLGIDVLEGLVALVEQSLLQRADDGSGAIRFRMLETIRAFAADRLRVEDDEAATRSRHAAAYARTVEATFDAYPLPFDRTIVERFGPDAANLRTACEQLIDEGQTEPSLLTTARLWRYWVRMGRSALGIALVDAALVMPGAEIPTPARVEALSARGSLLYWSGELEDAHRIYEKQRREAERIDDRPGVGDAWLNLTFSYGLQGEVDHAREANRQAGRIFEALEDDRRTGYNLFGWVAIERIEIGTGDADADTALIELLQDATERVGASDDPVLRSAVAGMRSTVLLHEGRLSAAMQESVAGVRYELSIMDFGSALTNVATWVPLLVRLELPRVAALVYATVEETKTRFGLRPPAPASVWGGILDPLPLLGELIDAGELEELLARGRSMSLEAVIDELEVALDRLTSAGTIATGTTEATT